MCIIVDVNCLSAVFDSTCAQHRDFSPVRDWIISSRRGYFVYGGTKFRSELKRAARLIPIINELHRAGRAISICDEAVDERERIVCERTRGTSCDDQHIIALVGVSRCPLVCTSDRRSHSFLKDRALYPRGVARPRIYSDAGNADLLQTSRPDRLKHVKT